MERPNYEGLDPYALVAFKGCHNRVRDGKVSSIFWQRNRQGYIDFCKEIGPKPEGMRKPSVGRIRHDLGYEPNNIRWEEHSDNSVKRRGTRFEGCTEPTVPRVTKIPKFKRGTQEHLEHQRKASAKRWRDPAQKELMSARMQGNQHWRGK